MATKIGPIMNSTRRKHTPYYYPSLPGFINTTTRFRYRIIIILFLLKETQLRILPGTIDTLIRIEQPLQLVTVPVVYAQDALRRILVRRSLRYSNRPADDDMQGPPSGHEPVVVVEQPTAFDNRQREPNQLDEKPLELSQPLHPFPVHLVV